MTHPDLAANIWTNPGENCGSTDPTITCAGRTDGIDNDGNGYVDDVHGWDWVNNDNDPSDDINHGTHVAGIVGAVGDNGIGVAGVNWTVRLMPLKICNAFCSISGEIQALQYAADKGVKIVNSSFGGPIPYVPSEHDAIQAAGAAGIIDVASASNNSTDNDVIPVYPASHDLDNIIAVAATNSTGDLASFSNFGATSVDLGAPGDNIYSTYPTDTYAALSGTSMAAPQVTGAAALLLAQNPTWTRQQIETRLIDTTHSLSGLTGAVASCGELDIGAATDAAIVNNARVCVKMSGTGSGAVVSAPAGIACGATCVASYSPGTSVTLTATAANGSTFTGWRGPCTGTGTCTVSPSSVIAVTALFRRGGSPGGWNQSPVTPPSGRVPFLPNSGREETFYNVSSRRTAPFGRRRSTTSRARRLLPVQLDRHRRHLPAAQDGLRMGRLRRPARAGGGCRLSRTVDELRFIRPFDGAVCGRLTAARVPGYGVRRSSRHLSLRRFRVRPRVIGMVARRNALSTGNRTCRSADHSRLRLFRDRRRDLARRQSRRDLRPERPHVCRCLRTRHRRLVGGAAPRCSYL